ncbi:MAG: hypothetical protein WC734_06090 [Patescibacteria group bacterium]|jgi:hypothetical protein
MPLTDRRGYLLSYPAIVINNDADVAFTTNAPIGTSSLVAPFVIPNDFIYVIRGTTYRIPATVAVGDVMIYLKFTRGAGAGILNSLSASNTILTVHNHAPFVILKPGDSFSIDCINGTGAPAPVYASVQIDVIGL